MKKRFLCFFTVFCMAVELFSGINLISYSKNRTDVFAPTVIEDGVFNYYSNFTKKTASYDFYYDENWFDDSAEKFNPLLARMSVRLAMSAADTDDSDIKDMFKKLGFKEENALISYPYPTDKTIGYAINRKEIAGAGGENYTLLVCAVRGGGYGAEWADNFNIGVSGNHLGFMTQAEKLDAAVRGYITSEDIKNENIKIWISGFSRGAAVANLVAHSLSQTYGNNNIYAYCFECPQAVEISNIDSVDKNIFNIINDIDFVTYVAPKQWNFGRYGVDCFIPSESTVGNSADYKKAKSKMSVEYGKIYSAANTGIKNENTFSYESPERENQSRIIRDLYSTLAKSLSREEAEKKLFPDVRKIICDSVSAGGIVLQLDSINIKNIFKTLISVAPGVLLSLIKNGEDMDSVTELFQILLQSHYPELCLAWMDTVTGFEVVDEAEYKLTVEQNPFKDVNNEDYYYNPVLWAVSENITNGTTEETFSPGQLCSKAHVLTFLWRNADSPADKGENNNPYTDVKGSDYFYNAAVWAYNMKITEGGSFKPDTPCSRAYAVYCMWKEEGCPKAESHHGFADVNDDDYYSEAVSWAVENNITTGTGETTFSPDEICTRGQVVTFLNKKIMIIFKTP